ncbi:MAG: YCF48-related protein [Ignavibacteria bacterium]
MKKLFFVFVISIISFNAHAQWFHQNTGAVYTLRSVQFSDQNTGWICGLESILKTTNGGENWNLNYLDGDFYSVFFINNYTGLVCGVNGKIKKTTDAGQIWQNINSSVNSTLNKISFINQNTGYIAGNRGVILKSTDSGENWIRINAGIDSLDIYTLEFVDNDRLLMSGSESMIYNSNDGGNSWNYYSLNMPNPLFTIEFINSNSGWVSGCCGMFLKTTDGGANWSKDFYLTPGFTLYSMKFTDDNFGMIVGSSGYILRTTNGGVNWDSVLSNTNKELYSLFLINKDTGFAVGNNGTVLKTTNGGGEGFTLGISSFENNQPEYFQVSQNFPNPFNPTTKISFSLLKSGNVTLEVFDISGKKISEIVRSRYEPGNYEIQFDGSELSSGVYLYNFKITDNFSSLIFTNTGKMLLVK